MSRARTIAAFAGLLAVAAVSPQIAAAAPPTAGFIFEPSTPAVNETITFSSISTDPDGEPAGSAHAWDLDGDGQFDDAVGRTVTHSFATPGPRTVSLLVTDTDEGMTSVASRTVTVRRAFDPMSPAPVVRLSGELRPDGGTLIERLTVTAPKRSAVVVTCTGADCPFRQQARVIYFNRVKFPAVTQKLQPGVVLRVFVTDPAKIGKFTRFRLRNGKAPERQDACLRGEARNPVPCPRQ